MVNFHCGTPQWKLLTILRLPYYITSRHIITCICTYTIQGILKGLASLPLMGWVVGTGADVRTLYHWIYTQRYVSNLTLSRATGGSYPGVRLLYIIKKENSKAVLTSFSPKSSRVNHVHVCIVVLYTAALSNSLG